jgi:hypothetical protein
MSELAEEEESPTFITDLSTVQLYSKDIILGKIK